MSYFYRCVLFYWSVNIILYDGIATFNFNFWYGYNRLRITNHYLILFNYNISLFSQLPFYIFKEFIWKIILQYKVLALAILNFPFIEVQRTELIWTKLSIFLDLLGSYVLFFLFVVWIAEQEININPPS